MPDIQTTAQAACLAYEALRQVGLFPTPGRYYEVMRLIKSGESPDRAAEICKQMEELDDEISQLSALTLYGVRSVDITIDSDGMLSMLVRVSGEPRAPTSVILIFPPDDDSGMTVTSGNEPLTLKAADDE